MEKAQEVCCLPLASAFNLRDFGGYATTDGRRVKTGMLYRSGTMALLTDADAAQLRTLGIRAICDFRRGNERAAEPTAWHDSDVDYYARDYVESSGVLGEILYDEAATAQDMHATMTALYRTIPIDHADSYRAMFAQMAAGRLPILINCAAGKDRTGVGAALILAALGVPRDRIVEDYLLTNVHADWDWRMSVRQGEVGRFKKARPEVLAPVLAADAAYLDALFQWLDAEHGGIEGYLAELGVDAAARTTLREALLDG
jgi:protein-tyrosine phosphatase